MVNQVQILTTGGTIDKEYPRALGGYAFEFGQITAAHRITNRVNAKIEIERVCALDSQGKFFICFKKYLYYVC